MVKNQAQISQHPAISLNCEIISWSNALSIAKIDAKSVSTVSDKYCSENVFQYYLCCNTWLNLIQDVIGERSCYSIKTSIQRDGLLSVISNASNLANQLIDYYQNGTPLTVPMGWFMPNIMDINLSDALQVLRYPKRFTPTSADVLLSDSLKKFKEINKYDRDTNHLCYPQWLVERMEEHLGGMLRYFEEEYARTVPKFSSGTTTCGRTVEKKLEAYARCVPYWCDPIYPIGNALNYSLDSTLKPWRFTPIVRAVPKNYKSYRIIAPEHPYYAAEKQRIKDAMRASIGRTKYGTMYTPEDQGNNQEKTRCGAIDGSYATIDLTSASDTISDSFAYYVLPSWFTCVTYRYHAEYFSLNGEWYRKYMFATSGDPICFDTEAMIFLSIALTVQDIAQELTHEQYLVPQVYGDDIVIDTRLFQSMMDVLRILRFIPNEDKSFGAGGYRESCGVEYYYGYDVSTMYWPRKTIVDPRTDVTSLESIIDLEHRLYRYWSETRFLTELVLDLYPTVTSSEAGSDCTDLWADAPWCAKRHAPMKKGAPEPADPLWTLREAHTSFVVKDNNMDRRTLDLEMYHYVNFLHNGPVYMTALDELLGISEPTQRTADFVIPKTVVSKTIK